MSGGSKPNFNFDWGKTGKKYIYRSQHALYLKMKRIYEKQQKYVEYWWEIYNFMEIPASKLVEDYEKWVKPFILIVWGYTEILPMFLLVGVE